MIQGKQLSLPHWVIGIMSGTSLDAVDVACIQTDGEQVTGRAGDAATAIPSSLQQQLHGLMHGHGDALMIERRYTEFVAACVNEFCDAKNLNKSDITICGFHGQTIIHRPEERLTWQLGNPSLLAYQTGLPVIADFRRRDMAAGGQGAPFVPVYHAALVEHSALPAAVVNIGGVANVTYLGMDGQIHAFDTGPGNALINDWVKQHTGDAFDADGRYAMFGTVHETIVQQMMDVPFFISNPPKSLDRNSFTLSLLDGLSLEDGAATLSALTVASIVKAQQFFPDAVTQWVICGGGRHNQALMEGLRLSLAGVVNADTLGWNGDALEAEAFAYLAMRSLRGLPLSFPETTGVTQPQTGGAFYC